jgi:TonB family protein
MGHSLDPSVQTFFGVPEGMNLRTLPLEQQQALARAAGEPSSWLHAEIEVRVDDQGAIVDARVVVPSGRRRFDRYALAAVKERVAGIRAPAATSRWAIEAAYVIGPLTSLSASFDVMMLFDKASRKRASALPPMGDEVRAKVALLWVRPDAPQE